MRLRIAVALLFCILGNVGVAQKPTTPGAVQDTKSGGSQTQTATTLSLTGLSGSSQENATYQITISSNSSTASDAFTVTSSDGRAQFAASNPKALTAGKAVISVQFATPGLQTLVVKDTESGSSYSLQTNVNNGAVSGCTSCFATLGAGAVIANGKYGDYVNSSNVLQATHLGTSTPQFVVGIAYKLPFRPAVPKIYVKNHCSPDLFSGGGSEGAMAFCYPWKAFVSLKFSPDASQTLNGFTYGISHSLHRQLDIMIGISYSSHSEISPGFLQAALSTVEAQQAVSNPNYNQFSLSNLKANGPTAFDGFPLQLQKSDGTTGPLIYSGNPLIQHYHPGLFIGVSVPLALKGLLSGGS